MTTICSATSIASSWSWVTKIVVTWISSCSAAQPLAQLGAHLRVERAEGLVEQQHLRLHGQRARQRHALQLAAGELGGIAAGEPVEAHQAEQLLDARADLVLGALAHAQAEADVVVHGHVLERRVVLEDEADPAVAGGRGGHVVARRSRPRRCRASPGRR